MRQRIGLNADQTARIMRVEDRTYERWEAGKLLVHPGPAIEIMTLYAYWLARTKKATEHLKKHGRQVIKDDRQHDEASKRPRRSGSREALSPDVLRHMRAEMGLSQDELRTLLGIGMRTYARWELGEFIIDADSADDFEALHAFWFETAKAARWDILENHDKILAPVRHRNVEQGNASKQPWRKGEEVVA